MHTIKNAVQAYISDVSVCLVFVCVQIPKMISLYEIEQSNACI